MTSSIKTTQRAQRANNKTTSDARIGELTAALNAHVAKHDITLTTFQKELASAKRSVEQSKYGSDVEAKRRKGETAVYDVTVFNKVAASDGGKKLLAVMLNAVAKSVKKRSQSSQSSSSTDRSCEYSNVAKSNKRPFLTLTESRKTEWLAAGGDGRGELLMSHVMLVANGLLPGGNDVASHLCNNGRCVKLSHLHWEPDSVNTSRKMCVSSGACKHHGPHPDCVSVRNDDGEEEEELNADDVDNDC